MSQGEVKATPKRRPGPQSLPAMVPSAALAAVIGPEPRPRTKVIQAMWEYIRAHGLQGKQDKRKIYPDAALGAVLGNGAIDMFAIAKELSKHLTRAAEPGT